MQEKALDRIRELPRGELELFAMRAMLQATTDRSQRDDNIFAAILTGFLFGAVVAFCGFLLGVRLG